MSEFKFACPVCGQHITADESTSGGQIDCPTCFQKIVVPQAPASPDTKFILSAAQVAKPRPVPPEVAAGLGPLPGPPSRSAIPAIVLLLVVLCGAGAALYVFRGSIPKFSRGPAPAKTGASAMPSNAPGALNPTYAVPTNFVWTLDPAQAVYPEGTAAGRIHGSGFLCERTTVQGGTLSLRQGKGWPPDLGITVLLKLSPGQQLGGKTIEFGPNHPEPPRIVIRWKDEQRETVTENIQGGYLLKLTFGQPAQGRLPGKIYLCLPDAAQSFIAGRFEAEIREPLPEKAPPRKRPRQKR